MTVKIKYLNHPVSCLGYRFELAGKSFCTLFDHEPFRNIFPTDPADPDYDPVIAEEGEIVVREENEKVENFYRGADLLLHDCQYTEQEYLSGKKGWGHSYFEYVVSSARKRDVKPCSSTMIRCARMISWTNWPIIVIPWAGKQNAVHIARKGRNFCFRLPKNIVI